ncbi:hypothetical protein [Azospirillum argentinense]|uniref:Uncharacterized protein n=1 Tax=Azospirillum argentinense TaxID=2970906 RepID=A0A5B0KQW5_9PROT|nr:hypothetical protein [Azospirillum argentinense]KAA1053828.1 hypothetical protein FH063_002410 [Azospirillum argentinense]
MRLIQLAAVSVVILGLAACARYPLGMSEADFRALTPEQQLEARTKQAELDVAEERRQAEQLAVHRQERAAYMARFYAGRAFATPMLPWMGAVPYPVPGPGVSVASPYSRVVIMGGQVNVPVGDGLVRTKRDWRPALPEAFILAEGETTNVEIERADGKPGSTTLRIARLNGTIVVGFDQEVYPLVGTYPLEIDGLIRGAAISIAPG